MKMEAAAIAYVRYVLNVLNLTPSALARQAKISSTTLTRALNDPNHKFTLSMTTLNKIADASGLSPAPFLDSEDQVNLAAAAHHPPEAFAGHSLDRRNALLNRETPLAAVIVVIGEVCPGYWQDPAVEASSNTPIFLALVGAKPRDTFACIARGSGALPIATDGEYLICRRIVEEDLRYLGGRMLVFQERSPHDKFRIELTIRLLQPREHGYDFVTLNPANLREKGAALHSSDLKQRDDLAMLGVVEYVARLPDPIPSAL